MREMEGWFVCGGFLDIKILSLSFRRSYSESVRTFQFDVSKQTFSDFHPKVEFFNLKMTGVGRGLRLKWPSKENEEGFCLLQTRFIKILTFLDSICLKGPHKFCSSLP